MSQVAQIKSYLKYRLHSTSKHGIHSPFIFHLLTEVIQKNEIPLETQKIEQLRNALLKDDRSIRITDYGAGSKVNSAKERKVKNIVKNSTHPKKDLLLFYRLLQHFQPKTLLELGTSLGISAAYIASAVPKSQLITLEGCAETAAIAKENFKKLHLQNVACAVGKFEDNLTPVLNNLNQLDFVFFDGNHQKEPTLNYFEMCSEKAHNDSLFIFDDIHWSEGMEAAWEKIKQHEKVQVTIDLFRFGLVFFRKEQRKQDFVIRY